MYDMTAHKETLEYGITIRIEYDTDYSLSDGLRDEPVTLLMFDRFGHQSSWHDGANVDGLSPAICRILRDRDARDDQDFTDEYDYRWELGQTEKRFWFKSRYEAKHFYKTREARFNAMLKEAGFDDTFVEELSSQRDTYFLVWQQSELDEYAGTKNAIPPVETVQALLDGEVYGFIIEDRHGDTLESVWGFVGDTDYCLQEARSIARCCIEEAKKAADETIAAQFAPMQEIHEYMAANHAD